MPKSSFVKESYEVLSDYFGEKPNPITMALLSIADENKEKKKATA